MSAPAVPLMRSSTWHNSASAISTAVSSTATDDPMASVKRVPTPTLNIVFGGRDDGDISVTSAAAPARFPAQSAAPASSGWLDDEPSLPAHPHRIEMSIDSLANYMLIEPIPVAIDPVGDVAFTAWIPNLDTNATGHSVVEALLLLKERIEFVYDDLSKRAHLSNEQKTTLQMLHTYIAPKKPEWV